MKSMLAAAPCVNCCQLSSMLACREVDFPSGVCLYHSRIPLQPPCTQKPCELQILGKFVDAVLLIKSRPGTSEGQGMVIYPALDVPLPKLRLSPCNAFSPTSALLLSACSSVCALSSRCCKRCSDAVKTARPCSADEALACSCASSCIRCTSHMFLSRHGPD